MTKLHGQEVLEIMKDKELSILTRADDGALLLNVRKDLTLGEKKLTK